MSSQAVAIEKKRFPFEQYIMEAILLCICVTLAFTAPNFLTKDNLLNILSSESMKGIIALGMTMVIIAGEIDLSVGSAAVFAGCLIAFLTKLGVPIPIGALVTIATGFGLGSFTGLLRVKLQVPTFITTLALFTGLNGIALMLTGGFSLTPFPDWYSVLGSGSLLGIPIPALVLLVAFAAVHFLMTYTIFGRAVYAVGGNAEATRLSGININTIRVMVLAITGALSAISGILLSSRLMSGSADAARGWELDVIAAVIIGGTKLTGGAGKAWGTMLGILFIGVIVNGMTLLNVPTYGQYIVRGALILTAVMLSQIQTNTK